MRKTPEVYLLAENRLLREALIRLLTKRKEVRIVGASGYSSDTLHEIVSARPQILLLDSHGLEFARSSLISTLRIAIPELRIVMVDMEPQKEVFLEAVRAGVVGYVVKDASTQEVAATIRAVAAGQAVCPPTLCMFLFHSIMEQGPIIQPVSGMDFGLTRREQELAELVCRGLTNKEIAARLNLSEQTVKNHVHRMLRKIGVPDRLGVAEFFGTRTSRERVSDDNDDSSSQKAS